MYRLAVMLMSCIMFTSACVQLPDIVSVNSVPSTITVTTPPMLSPTLSVREKWLQGIPCAPPCWEGITPGVTTFTQTLALVEEVPDLSDIQVSDIQTLSNNIIGIGLNAARVIPGSRGGIQELSLSVSASPLQEGGVVKSLFLSTPNMRLDEVVSRYGTPNYVQMLIGRQQTWMIRLLWLSQGFEMTVFGSQNVPDIDERFMVGEKVIYFAPGIAGYEAAMGREFEGASFIPWSGYGKVEYQTFILD